MYDLRWDTCAVQKFEAMHNLETFIILGMTRRTLFQSSSESWWRHGICELLKRLPGSSSHSYNIMISSRGTLYIRLRYRPEEIEPLVAFGKCIVFSHRKHPKGMTLPYGFRPYGDYNRFIVPPVLMSAPVPGNPRMSRRQLSCNTAAKEYLQALDRGLMNNDSCRMLHDAGCI